MSKYYRRIKGHVQAELESARATEAHGDTRLAFSHLERAHVLGQRSTRLHVLTHWRMLCWGLRRRRPDEVSGQLLRIIGATLLTAIGLVPEGNTGGANVNGFRRMPLTNELQTIIDGARADRHGRL